MKRSAISERLQTFADKLAPICSRTPLAKDRPLRWMVIANPTAGGFTITKRWLKHNAALDICAEKAAQILERTYVAAPSETALERGGELGAKGVVATTGPGDAGEIVRAVIAEAEAAKGNASMEEKPPFFLIITAGGDGTSLEALTELYALPESLKDRFAILRLPLGTGNDGADSWELDGALERLLAPSKISFARAVKLTTATAGKGPFLAFNILSVGLDAFVTHMTNKMKLAFPGDSYKLWVDIASLFYDRIYTVGEMEASFFDETGGLIDTLRQKTLLLAVGASGHRTYGSHKRILPDERNVCAVRQMPLLRKVALKELFTTGEHIHKPESALYTAARVVFTTANPILAQMDGEAVLLAPADYPATIELTPPRIPILEPLTP
jgi:diacylglycerol kinase family enzyme